VPHTEAKHTNEQAKRQTYTTAIPTHAHAIEKNYTVQRGVDCLVAAVRILIAYFGQFSWRAL
jgi:hypothetical protein